jgi:hypothetical protein
MISRRLAHAGMAALVFLAVAAGSIACGGPPAAATALPPGITWSGGWDTTFGPLVREQSDDTVLGVYKYPNGELVTTGVLRGQMHGAHLDFTWEEREGGTARGKGSFDMSADGKSFTGRWGYLESARDGVEWVGTRIK